MVRSWSWLSFCSLLLATSTAAAYEVPIADTDYDRQVCSGMWGGQNTYINGMSAFYSHVPHTCSWHTTVTFDSSSHGQLAAVIYEWGDVEYLGVWDTARSDDFPVSPMPATSPICLLMASRQQKIYVCTSDAQRGGFCDRSELGRFIVRLPDGKSVNDTSLWTARLAFTQGDQSSGSEISVGGLWNSPSGNPTPPESNYSSPWRRDLERRQSGAQLNPSPSGILSYNEPIQYLVRKTGYYCVGAYLSLRSIARLVFKAIPATVPITVLQSRQASTDVPYHPAYNGTVFFRNKFDGQLPASDYPKVNVRMLMP